MVDLILKGIVPVVFVLALGYYAGRKQFISADGARNFSTYIVNFALPCTLFVGIFSFTPQQFENGSFILTLCLALIVPFIVAVGIGIGVFKKSVAETGLFACNCGFPDMAYFGLPVLITIVGGPGFASCHCRQSGHQHYYGAGNCLHGASWNCESGRQKI